MNNQPSNIRSQWYYHVGGLTRGPVDILELARVEEMVANQATILVTRPGLKTWYPSDRLHRIKLPPSKDNYLINQDLKFLARKTAKKVKYQRIANGVIQDFNKSFVGLTKSTKRTIKIPAYKRPLKKLAQKVAIPEALPKPTLDKKGIKPPKKMRKSPKKVVAPVQYKKRSTPTFSRSWRGSLKPIQITKLADIAKSKLPTTISLPMKVKLPGVREKFLEKIAEIRNIDLIQYGRRRVIGLKKMKNLFDQRWFVFLYRNPSAAWFLGSSSSMQYWMRDAYSYLLEQEGKTGTIKEVPPQAVAFAYSTQYFSYMGKLLRQVRDNKGMPTKLWPVIIATSWFPPLCQVVMNRYLPKRSYDFGDFTPLGDS